VNEEIVVRETRTGTSYGLLVNFSALTAIILVTIVISDFSTMPYTLSVIISAFIYYLVFHYLIVMVYLMRRLFLLTVGGAFEDGSETNMDDQESENRTTIKRA